MFGTTQIANAVRLMPRTVTKREESNMAITPAKRRLNSAIANYARWSHEHDRTAATAKAREASMNRFRDAVLTAAEKASVILTDDEIDQRTAQLRSAHFSAMRNGYLQSQSKDESPTTPLLDLAATLI